MQQYSYKNSSIEWLGDIPEHWKIDRIKDKTTAVVGGDWGNDPDSETEGENVVVLRVADLDDIYFKFEDLTIRKIKNGSFKSRKVDERCLIIEKSGGGEKQLVGRVGYPIGIDFNAICSNFMAKIEFDNTMDLRFANYIFSFLYSCDLNFPFVQQTTGIQNLNVTYYLNSKVAFPPLPEQKAIAEYLDKACARIDRIIAIKEEQLRKIEGYYISVRHKLITLGVNNSDFVSYDDDFLKKVPKHWKKQKLRYLLELKNGKLITNDELVDDGEIPVYGGNGIMGRTDKYNYDGELLIIGRVGAKCGNVHYTNQKIWVSDNAISVRSIINYQYMYQLLTVIDLHRLASETAQPLLVGNNVKKLYVAIPPISEQMQIIEKIEAAHLKTQNLKKKVSLQINTLQSYRKSLIHECVTGKKQVADVATSTIQEINA